MLSSHPRAVCCTGLALLAACGATDTPPAGPPDYRGGAIPLARQSDAAMLAIPAGTFVAGSSREERARAREQRLGSGMSEIGRFDDEADAEREPHQETLPAFLIDAALVSQDAYAEYVADAGAAPPALSEHDWSTSPRLRGVPFYLHAPLYRWRGGRPPEGRGDHPVVLVTWREAAAYCAWRGRAVGRPRRLPTAAEYEKAARGDSGSAFPWGNEWDPKRLNGATAGPGQTTAVEAYAALGASPYGLLDGAGNAQSWSATPWPAAPNAMTVKGSGWNEHGTVGRGAAVRGVGAEERLPWLGFRCAGN